MPRSRALPLPAVGHTGHTQGAGLAPRRDPLPRLAMGLPLGLWNQTPLRAPPGAGGPA